MLSSELTSSLLPYAIILAMVSITNAQLWPTAFMTERLWLNDDRWNLNTPKHNTIDPLTSDRMIETGRVSKTLRPPSGRRFLFSPTIQNTITNLNQNSNLQEASESETTDSKTNYGHVNPQTGAMEYDIRNKRPKKICITFE